MLPITGYADRLSVQPGHPIAFKVSSDRTGHYRARLVRVVSGDPNPEGQGIVERPVPSALEGTYPARFQPVHLGSYGRVDDTAPLRALESFTVMATVWPTTPGRGEQGIVSRRVGLDGPGFSLLLGADGGVAAVVRDAAGVEARAGTGRPLRQRAWYRVWMSWDAGRGRLVVGQAPLAPVVGDAEPVTASARAPVAGPLDVDAPLSIAALGGDPVGGHYNGKIERPMIIARALAPAAVQRALDARRRPRGLAACWDFSREIGSTRIVDVGPSRLDGQLVNLPARAMVGSNWTGREMCWRHAPEEYGAIHFHDDDIHDCGWETDFTFQVPDDLPSGVYAVRLERDDGAGDMIPFYVRPRRGRPTARHCVLIPTFTYIVYTNYQRHNADAAYRARVAAWGARPWNPDDHPDYGLSTYDFHSDGSGICYSSRLRPAINMRSGFLAYVDPRGSGLRHFPADTHLLAWLDRMGHQYDVITDEDLDEEGVDLIRPYKVVQTCSHPEYHTPGTLQALESYTAEGGRLMYMGGNGFYWKVARNPDLPGVVEVRRGEGGIRAWAAEPGEYYNALDGEYGGLWRRNGRPPQRLAGIGFSSQGLFEGNHYSRTAVADDPRVAWAFEGVEARDFGGYGFSGGGAAGFELDRHDARLGSDPNALVVATSRGNHRREAFVLVPEDLLTNVYNWTGEPDDDLIRADMVYFERPNGGAVFSVGSITFCGSLPWNGCDNDVSRLIDNVLRRFRDT
ncbi:MAG: N,N-dimethylformamidase large subunit [Ectothiorhodospiraceae bacterium]|nr:N,N-dimethylformamidase large subunit [Ectothiorhodospiraceae bacterium]